jgi:hypothetical protein
MLAVAKAPRIRVEITGVGARAVATALKKSIPGITITDDSESEALRGSGWFEKMESDLTPGRALRVYRGNAGLTLAALSEKTGIPAPHLSGMEHDKRPIGKLNARRLAEALNCDYRRFL